MNKNLLKAGVLAGITLLFTACNKDDNDGNTLITDVDEITTDFNVPIGYEFTRNSESSVSFGGQTTRLKMNKEILDYFKVGSGKTATEIESAFDHTAGTEDFEDTELNASSKSVKSKIAASDDLFGADAVSKGAIQAVFSSYITSQVSEVFPQEEVSAQAGVAGNIVDGTKTRYVSAKGLEYDQAFAKGSIGALIVDQVLNNYLGTADMFSEEDRAANNAETVAGEGKNYTTLEHHFDEAYGYVYALADSQTNPLTKGDDAFLFKYITSVNGDSDFAGIQDQIFKAFKIGRAAIVAQDYDVLEDAITVLQYNISKVVGIRAVYYLQAGKAALAAQDNGGAFHDLSEGYGFVYSLQFTRNPNTDAPYLSATEVNSFIAQLEAGNGFWDLTDGTVLDNISNTIASKFDFTVDQVTN